MAEENEAPSATRTTLGSWSDNLDAAVAVAKVATYKLSLLSRDLEPQVYGQDVFLDEVRRVAISGRFAQVRILVQDSRRAIRDGHKLIELARRLSSFITLHNPHPEHAHINETFLVADERALLYRKESERFEGYADTDMPMEARQRLREFEAMWERSVPDPELRRLGV